ncbi:MAG TPA: type II toxin-antitoxin system VapC family toxin [Polyangiaceae bacterium]
MIYFDAAFIAKCYLNEPGADRVRKFARSSDGLCACEVGRLEFFSTVKRHQREGRLTRAEVRAVLTRFESDDGNGVWSWLPVTAALLQAACEAVRELPVEVPLRALDALHLQCARDEGLSEVYTNDRHMTAAAPHFRLIARNLLVE